MADPSISCGDGRAAATTVHRLTGTEVQLLLFKLAALYPHLPRLPCEELLLSEHCQLQPGCGRMSGAPKHLLQHASIIGHLEAAISASSPVASDGVLRDFGGIDVAIELGAGTARLSDQLQQVTSSRLHHVLVDRQDFRPQSTRDLTMARRAANRDATGVNADADADVEVKQKIHRVVGDLADWGPDLAKWCKSMHRVACCSKHLCGPAGDHAIRLLQATLTKEQQGQEQEQKQNAVAFCAATCCHYLCTWPSFCGRDFWTALGLDADDFRVAVAVSQWTSLRKPQPGVWQQVPGKMVCRSDVSGYLPNLAGLASVARAQVAAAAAESGVVPHLIDSDTFEATFSRDAKADLGIQAKELLDIARASFMQSSLAMDVKLVRYTTHSPEDRLLVAVPAVRSTCITV